MADEVKRPARRIKVGPFRLPGDMKSQSSPGDSRSVLARRVKRQLRGVVREPVSDPDEDVRIVPRRPAGEAPPTRRFLPPSVLDDDDE